MHSLLHLALDGVFVVVIAILLALFVQHRPGGTGRLTRRQWLAWLAVGVILAGIFISTNSLYAQTV
ncbi:hypothetical protein D2Q93_16505 [Alicyclobacillaceae bacterium I2511]|nr:hypothetical protein D2Q93_16505 [Alicyclobacillaceae bacterium I2511]